MTTLHTVAPREQVGRDTLERFNAQVRAASMACLSILEGKEVKKIYCEFHDDFVIEKIIQGKSKYFFVQVKTKGKLREIWGVNDVFGILKKTTAKKIQSDQSIRDSFAGKLLQHTMNFPDTCESIIFMTNTHVDEDIETLLVDISNDVKGKHSAVLVDRFNHCFIENYKDESSENHLDDKGITDRLKKINIETDVEYLKDKSDTFSSIARNTIYRYSEIDLEYSEANEIIISLLSLVNKKSSVKITHLTPENILNCSAIDIDDLLEILSISKNAYYDFLNNGDENAIKTASVIERTLRRAGSSNQEIQFCAECKIKWDFWVRHNRHILSKMDFNSIDGHLEDVVNKLAMGGGIIRLSLLRKYVLELIELLKSEELLFDLDSDIIIGAIFSKIVGHEK